MNPKYLVCLLTLFLNSCSYAKYTYAPYSKIDPQIHSLYVTHTKSMDYDRMYNVFKKELDQNIFAQESTPKGILEITQVKYPQVQSRGIGYIILGCLTGFVPSLIGVPMCMEEYSPEYDFIIYDIYGNIIANYTITSSKKYPIFLYNLLTYHKYRIEVLKDIMNQLRNKLKSDAHIINYKLEFAEISATESDLQNFNKLIVEYRKGNNSVNRNLLNPTMSGNIDYNNHQIVDNQVTNYGRSKEQITEHIKKLEKIKADCERYLKEENSKEGSSYSPTRAFMWEKQIMDANKQLEQLRAELLRTQH